MNARRNSGPMAEMLVGVNAGTTLAKIKHGSDNDIVTWEAPLSAEAGNRPVLAIAYPTIIVMYLLVNHRQTHLDLKIAVDIRL
jgi:hypothetical protein